jgi:hypothetical protein
LESSPLRKLVWLLVAIAAMVMLAPAAASAHEGHHSKPGVSADIAARQQQMVCIAGTKPDTAQPVVYQPVELGTFDGNSVCSGSCCFGAGCCAGTIISEIPALDLPLGPRLVVHYAPRSNASVRLTSLLEPPNSLT